MKTLVVGDTHADPQVVANVHRHARDTDVEAIVQLGDFGFGFSDHGNVLKSINAWLDRDEAHKWYWVDGNHDNHDRLAELVDQCGWDAPIQFGHERLFYVPRGCVFQIGDTVCMGLGGAYSIDKSRRKPHVSWWPGEMITAGEMYRAVNNPRVEDVTVMFTHDAPMSEVLETMLSSGNGYKTDPHSLANRASLSRVVDEVRPQRLFHGHYHERYRTTYTTPEGWDVQVEGVGANLVRKFSGWVVDHYARIDDNVLEEDF